MSLVIWSPAAIGINNLGISPHEMVLNELSEMYEDRFVLILTLC